MIRYFIKLGATGFGGPVALANYMRRDLVERDRWLTEEEYDRGLAVATACPGPLAYQLGVYCGYVKHGIAGGVSVGLVFAFAPFVLVVAFAAAYVHFAEATWIRSLFYGVGPVVVALILRACWNLGLKTLKQDPKSWIVAGITLVATLIFQRELTALFVVAGLAGVFLFAPPGNTAPTPKPKPSPTAILQSNALFVLAAVTVPAATSVAAWNIFTFSFGPGCSSLEVD